MKHFKIFFKNGKKSVFNETLRFLKFFIFQNPFDKYLNSTIFWRSLFEKSVPYKMEILLPPHTPPMKIFRISACIMISWNLTNAQTPQLKPLEDYNKSLKYYHNKLWTAERKEFTDLNIKSFFYYLPNIGLQFGLPSIQFGLKDLLNYKREKKIFDSKLKSLDLTANVNLNEALQALQIEYNKTLVVSDRLKAFQAVTAIKKKIWNITQECCKKNECQPTECYKTELEITERSEQEFLLIAELRIKILEIEKLAKYNLPEEKI
ncbi:MAG: hypothetical protein MUF45_10055, partial [Spirosomaceae bacterium]|nr:hypothetical protein [Spirosomataceae bacterium]